jgi:repressor LexA
MNTRLSILKKFYIRNNRLPTYTEMLILFKVKSRNAVHFIIHKLIREGFLQKQGTQIAPTDEFFSLPVLGIIPAGSPATSEFPSGEKLVLSNQVFSSDTYALKVTGDSMKDEGINEGDTVIIDSKRVPKNGDIVAAYIDNDWTLKYFEKKGTVLVLKPANKKYFVLKPKQQLILGGVVVQVIRKYY